jgi:hypothetical protein
VIEVFKCESKEWKYIWRTFQKINEEGGMELSKGMMQGGGFKRLVMMRISMFDCDGGEG